MSKIRWKVDCEFEVAAADSQDYDNTITECRHPGHLDNADIVGYAVRFVTGRCVEDPQHPLLRFFDGSTTLAVNASWFEIIDDNPTQSPWRAAAKTKKKGRAHAVVH